MPAGEQERQEREVFQRNMRSRMENFKTSRHKRHKKDRSQKKVFLLYLRLGSQGVGVEGNYLPKSSLGLFYPI